MQIIDILKNILTQDEIKYLYEEKCYTFFMRLVNLSNKNPKLYDIIEEYCKENPSEINKLDHDGLSAIIMASINKNTNVVKILCDNGANVNYGKNLNCWPALLHAADKGCIDIVKILCDNEANINYCSKGGYTALQFAVQNGHEDIVKFLCAKGANVNLIPYFIDIQSSKIVTILLEYDFVMSLNMSDHQHIFNKINLLMLRQ